MTDEKDADRVIADIKGDRALYARVGRAAAAYITATALEHAFPKGAVITTDYAESLLSSGGIVVSKEQIPTILHYIVDDIYRRR